MHTYFATSLLHQFNSNNLDECVKSSSEGGTFFHCIQECAEIYVTLCVCALCVFCLWMYIFFLYVVSIHWTLPVMCMIEKGTYSLVVLLTSTIGCVIYGCSLMPHVGRKKESNALEATVKRCLFITCGMTCQWHSDLSRWTKERNHWTTLWQHVYLPLNCQIHNAVKVSYTFNFSVCLASASLFVDGSGFVLVTLTTHSFLSFPINLSLDTQCTGLFSGWSSCKQGREFVANTSHVSPAAFNAQVVPQVREV